MLKLVIKDEIDLDFSLIAIHSILDDYKLVFWLNKLLPIKLSKSIQPMFLKNKNKKDFEFFKYENEDENVFWYLIPNQIKIKKEQTNFNLFNEILEENEYFVSELKKIDYIIKITDNNINILEFIKKINQINHVSTAVEIDLEKIKHKNHLIF